MTHPEFHHPSRDQIAKQPAAFVAAESPPRGLRHLTDESGQTTAEYALVLLGVAAIAMMVLAWAGQTDSIERLFDSVLESILGLVP